MRADSGQLLLIIVSNPTFFAVVLLTAPFRFDDHPAGFPLTFSLR